MNVTGQMERHRTAALMHNIMCFAVLRQLRQIRRYVSMDTFQELVIALVVTRLDYGNAVLTGLPLYLLRRLQSVLNADPGLTTLRPCVRRADQPTLAAHSAAHPV